MKIGIDPALSNALNAAETPREKTIALFDFMRRRGQAFYDEAVTQLQHATQAAQLARESQASHQQVTAALLHDIGHFLTDEESAESDFSVDDWFHETIGAEHLSPFLGDEVTEPIRLHVPAKRYLCTVDASYYEGLSPASQRSFQLQGGKMSVEEVAEFEANPFHQSAVLLRRWDDGAKVTDLDVPELESFQAEVETSFQNG